MAERDNNKNINKVSLSNGTVLMDTSGVTVTPAYLLEGYTALDKTGTLITGTMQQQTVVVSEENDSHGGKIIYITGDTVNLQAKTVTPTKNVQNIGSDTGYNGLSVVTVNPIPNDYIIPAGTLSITTNGTQDVSNYAAVNVNIETASQEINLQEKTATPSETQQEIIADNAYDGLSKVTVSAISKTYIGTGVTRISNNSGITFNGHTVSVRGAAYYTGNVSATIPLQNKTATPNTTEQEIVADSGYSGLSKVTVSPIPSQYVIPSGTITITENGTVDVSNKASAEINVQPNLYATTVTPTKDTQVITASYDTQTIEEEGYGFQWHNGDPMSWDSALSIGTKYLLSVRAVSTIETLDTKKVFILPANGYTFTSGNFTISVTQNNLTITRSGSDSTLTFTMTYKLEEILAEYNGLSSVTVNPIPAQYIIPTGSVTITENGTVNVNNIAEAVVNITPKLQDRNVLPTGTQQIITPTNNAYGPLLYKTDVEFVYNQEYEWGFNLEVGKYYALITTGQNGPDGDIDIDFTFDGNSITGVAEDGSTSFTITATGLTFNSSPSMVYQDSYSLVLSADIPNNYFYGLSSVIVEPIPSTYVGTGIIRRNSNALTVNGATVTAPAGYYIGAASKSVASGSATTPATTITANPSISVNASGLITATASASQSVTPTITAGYVSAGTAGTVTVSGNNTQQLTTQGATTITPTKQQQTAVTAGKYTTGAVTVAAIPAEYITTTDATAAAADILSGETAYVNGAKVTGTLVIQHYYTGSSDPSASLGEDGDIYLKTGA